MKNSSIYILIFLLIGCSKDINVNSLDEDKLIHIDFKFKSNLPVSNGATTTCAFALFEVGDAPRQGTYYVNTAKLWLAPCSVDVQGLWIADDATKGLSGKTGDFTLAAVSPAIKAVQVLNTNCYGYLHTRTRTENEILYVGEPTKVSILGRDMNGLTIFSFNEHYTLKEQRTKLKLKMYCESQGAEFTITDILIKNVIEKGYLCPLHGYHIADINNALKPFVFPFVANNTSAEVPTTNKIEGENVVWILSANYNDTEKYETPIIEITVKLSESEVKTITVPLAYDFKPQHIYTLSLKFSTINTSVSISSASWGEVSDNGQI